MLPIFFGCEVFNQWLQEFLKHWSASAVQTYLNYILRSYHFTTLPTAHQTPLKLYFWEIWWVTETTSTISRKEAIFQKFWLKFYWQAQLSVQNFIWFLTFVDLLNLIICSIHALWNTWSLFFPLDRADPKKLKTSKSHTVSETFPPSLLTVTSLWEWITTKISRTAWLSTEQLYFNLSQISTVSEKYLKTRSSSSMMVSVSIDFMIFIQVASM